jgi:hypothetical protein
MMHKRKRNITSINMIDKRGAKDVIILILGNFNTKIGTENTGYEEMD